MYKILNLKPLEDKNIQYQINDSNIIFFYNDKKTQVCELPKQINFIKKDDDLYLKPNYLIKKNFQKIFIKKITNTYISLCNNCIIGLEKGYHKKINIVGMGYRSSLNEQKREITFYVGYSHPIIFPYPEGIQIKLETNGTIIHINGIDKYMVHMLAEKMTRIRKRNPYKGFGIFRQGDFFKKKTITKK